jgi:hypothetical protein
MGGATNDVKLKGFYLVLGADTTYCHKPLNKRELNRVGWNLLALILLSPHGRKIIAISYKSCPHLPTYTLAWMRDTTSAPLTSTAPPNPPLMLVVFSIEEPSVLSIDRGYRKTDKYSDYKQ